MTATRFQTLICSIEAWDQNHVSKQSDGASQGVPCCVVRVCGEFVRCGGRGAWDRDRTRGAMAEPVRRTPPTRHAH